MMFLNESFTSSISSISSRMSPIFSSTTSSNSSSDNWKALSSFSSCKRCLARSLMLSQPRIRSARLSARNIEPNPLSSSNSSSKSSSESSSEVPSESSSEVPSESSSEVSSSSMTSIMPSPSRSSFSPVSSNSSSNSLIVSMASFSSSNLFSSTEYSIFATSSSIDGGGVSVDGVRTPNDIKNPTSVFITVSMFTFTPMVVCIG